MQTNEHLRMRIKEFAALLREEFGPLAVGQHGCVLESAEEWGLQVGDELARAAMEQELPSGSEDSPESEEAECPRCHQMGRWKGPRKRRIETRRGPIHVSEPEYFCPRCRRSFFPSDTSIGHDA